MDLRTTRAIVERASSQLDLLTRSQLHEAGVSPSALHRARRSGLLVPVGHRTFSLPERPDTFERRALAACLDTGGLASHRTAAALHGLHGFPPPATVEVTVPHGRRHQSSPLATVHATTDLPADDLVSVGPVPCVGVARTFLMLAALVPEVPAEAIRTAIGDAAREGRVSDAWLWWRLEELRCRGRTGVTALEEILRRRQSLGPTESWLEHTFLEVLERAGLPLPQVQQRIVRDGRFVGRVDALYPEHRLVIEVEGHRHHSTPEQRAADEARRRQLVLAGYRVLVVTADEVVHRPGRVVADVAAALAERPAA